ncbi:MAG: hypothetical protein Q9184_007185 [Pyrenodesmia sp. 2 TL-2023]
MQLITSFLALSALCIASPLGHSSTSAIINAENAHVGYHHTVERAAKHPPKSHRPVSVSAVVDAENAHVGYHHPAGSAVIDVEDAHVGHWWNPTSAITSILSITVTAPDDVRGRMSTAITTMTA